MRSLRSGYAFSHQQGFGDLITTGSIMSVRPRPRSARIKGPLPRFGQQQQQQQSASVDVDDEWRPPHVEQSVSRVQFTSHLVIS